VGGAAVVDPCRSEVAAPEIDPGRGEVCRCKKLSLYGDEPLANLHAAERRLDLPRRTCTDHRR
jgi:hypothetical protein